MRYCLPFWTALSKESCEMTLTSQPQPEPDDRNLALARKRLYRSCRCGATRATESLFLNQAPAANLTVEWFGWFVGLWKVARNIKDAHHGQVRNHLDCEFRQALSVEDSADCVDAAARYFQRQGWTSRGCFPVSLVSKAGFFLRPDRLVPMDRFSVQGLNLLRAARGRRKLKREFYKAYLEAFDQEYVHSEGQLKLALKQPWVVAMADRTELSPRNALGSVGMRRKLFDDYLMHVGDYRA